MLFLKVAAVRIFVADIQRASLFYTKVLGLNLINLSTEHGVLVVGDGSIDIIVEQVDATESTEGRELKGRFTGISFSVDNITQAYKELSDQGVLFTGLPEKQYWGGTLATFLDLDDNELQLVEAADVATG
ncbi:MAG: VOC family protein [Granulosicoccus sp.]|nr:VOC family protein [Granulosicoccus sp.]